MWTFAKVSILTQGVILPGRISVTYTWPACAFTSDKIMYFSYKGKVTHNCTRLTNSHCEFAHTRKHVMGISMHVN